MMINNYFITGFPRSRTSWLANFFTYKDSYCYHELSRQGRNVYDLVAKMSTRKESYVGTSDCGFSFYYEDILKLLPNSKIVIIERDIEDVKDSLSEFVGGWNDKLNDIIDITNKKLSELSSKYDCKFVNYISLEDKYIIRGLWEYLIPEIEWDEERFNQLDETRVCLIKNKWLSNTNVDNFKTLLGV
jgi:hypothetical protein